MREGSTFETPRRGRDSVSPEERRLIDEALTRFAAEGRPVRVRAYASGCLPLFLYGRVLGRLRYGQIVNLARVRAAMVAGAATLAQIAERTGLSEDKVERYRRAVIRVEGERP